ncbi:hypothetical protein Efla_000088 [Eimeria flavescens]
MRLPSNRPFFRPHALRPRPTCSSSSSSSTCSSSGSSSRHSGCLSPAAQAAAAAAGRWRRSFSSLAAVAAAQQYTRLYDEAFMPRRLRKLRVFSAHPPESLPQYYHEKLSRANSNPRSIIKLYRRYIRVDDEPDYAWLVRCFCQLGNAFGFNSFWAPRDKQRMHAVPNFKFLVYDLVERKHLIQADMVPRLLYALAALEYRSSHLLPTLLEHVEANLHHWRPPTACNMALCLALLGVGDSSGYNSFGAIDVLSRDYSHLITRLALHVFACMQQQHAPSSSNSSSSSTWPEPPASLAPFLDGIGCSPFDYAGLAFALAITNEYDWLACVRLKNGCLLAVYLQLTKETLPHSGWVQHFVYLILYLTDVEQPKAAEAIKRAVPFELQELLHLSWLDGVLLKGQPHGSEELQTDVDAALKRLHSGALINCSVGRPFDEQHCFFADFLLKEKNLAIQCDYLMPLGAGRPKPSGLISCKQRIFAKFGLNVAVIHRCFWDLLSMEQKDVQLTRLMAKFPSVCAPQLSVKPSYEEDRKLKFKRHQRAKHETWPPEKIEI